MSLPVLTLSRVAVRDLSFKKFVFWNRENLFHCRAKFFGRLLFGRGRHDRTVSPFTPFATSLSFVVEDHHRPPDQ